MFRKIERKADDRSCLPSFQFCYWSQTLVNSFICRGSLAVDVDTNTEGSDISRSPRRPVFFVSQHPFAACGEGDLSPAHWRQEIAESTFTSVGWNLAQRGCGTEDRTIGDWPDTVCRLWKKRVDQLRSCNNSDLRWDPMAAAQDGSSKKRIYCIFHSPNYRTGGHFSRAVSITAAYCGACKSSSVPHGTVPSL